MIHPGYSLRSSRTSAAGSTFITRLFLTTMLAAGFTIAHGQDISELDKRNGFKTIILGYPIDSIKGSVFKKDEKEKDEYPVKLYTVDNEVYKKIGEVEVKEIELYTYQDQIYKISVTTEKDPRVMKALEKSFGKANYVVRTSSFNWKAENLSLTFLAHKNSIQLIYRSFPVILKMKADKEKKVDDIADDF